MSTCTYILLGSRRLRPYEKELRRSIKKYISFVKKYLPLKDIDIVVLDNPEFTIKHLGIGGYTANEYTLYINLNPGYKKFNETIDKHLFRTVAHELHHVMRCKTVGYGETLLEALISEGLADHFEIELTGGVSQAWDKALSNKQINQLLEKAKKEFNNKAYSHKDWFFGSEKRNIPVWAGYSLGFYLIQKYLDKNTKQRASTLYKTKASALINIQELK